MNRSLRDRLAALEQSVHRSGPVNLQSKPIGPEDNTTVADEVVVDTRLEAPGLYSLGFRRVHGALGGVWVRTLSYDLLTLHGDSRFSDLLGSDLDGLARAAKLPAVPEVSKLRFYDTETSGLGTGAGTFPFLHAVAQVRGDELQVHQYLLADAMEEPALLVNLCENHFADPTGAVVSFNGRSFDWPLFQSRLVMHRLTERDGRPLAQASQVDLLHPSRRLWKSAFGSMSLASLEQNLLGVHRVEDLPGREAPARYFAYMRTGDITGLVPVLEHNALDVCSLVVLAARIADLLSGQQTASRAGEHVALGRWYEEWRAFDLAGACYEAAAACPDADWRALWLHALYLKRQGALDEAVAVWCELLDRFADSALPAVELAKVAEHRDHNWGRAAAWTQQAIDRRKRQLTANGTHGRTMAKDGALVALAHRLERIRRKAESTPATNSAEVLGATR